jgi:hypothetical protein
VAFLSAALETHAKPGDKAGLLLNWPGDPESAQQFPERGDRDIHIGPGSERAGIASLGAGRSRARARSCPGGSAGLEHRSFVGRYHRLRHQPRARPGSAPSAHVFAHRRQRELGLGLRMGADSWAALRGRIRRTVHPLDWNLAGSQAERNLRVLPSEITCPDLHSLITKSVWSK